jgi:short-subunit dehydrogenase
MPSVFITGASSGIGAALARHYAARGATVGLIARRAQALDSLRVELGASAWCRAGDVADAAFVQRAAADFSQAHGVPDIVIANAGISVGTLGAEADDLPMIERMLRTNVLGMAATLQPFVATMCARGSGRLVGIASIAGFRGLAGSGGYSASKSAAITWLESLRAEVFGSGVRVVTVCPGYIDTPMTRVNRYRMPFLLTAEEGARRIARAIDAGRSLAVVPWQMHIAALALRAAPNWLYDRFAARAPRKPRGLPT